MPSPKTKLENSDITTLAAQTIGASKPYQLQGILDALKCFKWERGSVSDTTAQPTITQILSTNLANGNNP